MSDSEDTHILIEQSKFRTIRTCESWPSVKVRLKEMADGLLNSDEIISALGQFKNISHSKRFGKARTLPKRQFQKLRDQYDDELPTIFSRIAQFLLQDNTLYFPLFKKGVDSSHSFQKQQVLFLLCSMVLCLIPRQQYDQQKQELNFNLQLDFSVVFQSSLYKTKAIMEYIKQELNKSQAYDECLTIKRHAVRETLKEIFKPRSQDLMCSLVIKEDSQSIEDHYGDLKVDFANKYIGGGALGSGCVQEEIMFANHPQLHITQLLCEQMNPNQSILLIGFKKYSKNQGYSYKTKYGGKQKHAYQYDSQRRAKQYIVAIDALHLERRSFSQYRECNIRREILKAYSGFVWKQQGVQRIVSGNWGCGAFGGNIEVKFIIQWIACSLAQKKMVYCPFGSKKTIDTPLLNSLKTMKVGLVYDLLLRSIRKICNRFRLRQQTKGTQNAEQQVSIFKQMQKLIELNSP